VFESGSGDTKNSKYECINYRPISLLCHLTKIYEKLIAQKVTKYQKKFQLLSKCQYGFREGYSTTTTTTTAIADIYDELLCNCRGGDLRRKNF